MIFLYSAYNTYGCISDNNPTYTGHTNNLPKEMLI